MIDLIEQHRKALLELCRKYGVRRLDLIGSALRMDFDPSRSDLDFVVASLFGNARELESIRTCLCDVTLETSKPGLHRHEFFATHPSPDIVHDFLRTVVWNR